MTSVVVQYGDPVLAEPARPYVLPGERGGGGADRGEAAHRTDPEEIGEIINASVGPVWRWPVYEVPLLERWHRTAMVIGDAAHAIQPHLGVGATLALEDAYELTAAMRREPDVAAAWAWEVRNWRQVGPERCGAGSMSAA